MGLASPFRNFTAAPGFRHLPMAKLPGRNQSGFTAVGGAHPPADAARPLPDGAKVDDADSPFEKPARRPSPTGGRPPPENHLPAGSLPEGSRRRDGRIFDPWTRSGWSGNAPRPGLRGAEGFLLGKTTRMMDQMRNEQRGEACRGDGEERPERRKLNRVLPASASNLPVRARYFRRRVGEAG